MSDKTYAVLESNGTVWGVIVCAPNEIRRHVVALGKDAYIRRPDENAGGKLKMIEPGAKILNYAKAGKKAKNPDSITIRGVTDPVAPIELPADLSEEE